MTRTNRHHQGTHGTIKRQHKRLQPSKLLKDFEREYIARNKDPHIYL